MTRQPIQVVRRIATFVLFLSLPPAVVNAQNVATNFDELRFRIATGDTIYITDPNGLVIELPGQMTREPGIEQSFASAREPAGPVPHRLLRAPRPTPCAAGGGMQRRAKVPDQSVPAATLAEETRSSTVAEGICAVAMYPAPTRSPM